MYIEPPVCRTRRTGGHSKIHSAGDADQEYIHTYICFMVLNTFPRIQYTFYSTINGYKNRTTTYYIATIERIGKLMEMGKLGLTISYDCKGIYTSNFKETYSGFVPTHFLLLNILWSLFFY